MLTQYVIYYQKLISIEGNYCVIKSTFDDILPKQSICMMGSSIINYEIKISTSTQAERHVNQRNGG